MGNVFLGKWRSSAAGAAALVCWLIMAAFAKMSSWSGWHCLQFFIKAHSLPSSSLPCLAFLKIVIFTVASPLSVTIWQYFAVGKHRCCLHAGKVLLACSGCCWVAQTAESVTKKEENRSVVFTFRGEGNAYQQFCSSRCVKLYYSHFLF